LFLSNQCYNLFSMTVFGVYLGYLWVSVIHTIFAGATLYLFWGRKIISWKPIWPIAILTLFLAFLEVYWIPCIGAMQLGVFTQDPGIQSHFGIDGNTNIAEILRPGITQVFIWIATGVASNYLGRWGYNRILRA
jgi:hypothetical protein